LLVALGDYLAGRAPEYALEFRLRHKDGSYRCIYTRGLLLRDTTGRATHLIGCHLDITERRHLEAQHRESQKLQAVGQLAGGVAHDFNNLLVIVDGYAAGIAMDLPPDHPAQPQLAEIRAATARAAEMTRQLLAFSRRQTLQPQVLDPNDVVRQMRQLLTRVVGPDITLRFKLSAASRVRADRGQLERVLMNLAINARDAMPGGGQLTITTRDVDLEAGPHVLIMVGDTGTGMDDLTRAHLFEPYFTTKPAGRGTGLGLATVYGIVTQSGGTISVHSEPDHGSTFEICLPATGGPPPRD
jgi:signal transduction histidine kinase